MIYQEARAARHIVGHLEDGESVVESLTDFCRDNDVKAAEIRGAGSLKSIELVTFDPESGEFVPVYEGSGSYELLHVNGNVSVIGDEIAVRLDVVIGVEGPMGQQTKWGQLREGVAETCEFFIDIFEDLEIERRLDRQTGRMPVHKIRRDSSVEETTSEQPEASRSRFEGKGLSWEDAAEESQGQTSKSDSSKSKETSESQFDDDEPFIESGDILQHPKLGRCHVMKVEGDQYLHIRLPKGKIRKLSLAIVDITFVEEQNGTNIFKAEI